jgi:hypothetical protein
VCSRIKEELFLIFQGGVIKGIKGKFKSTFKLSVSSSASSPAMSEMEGGIFRSVALAEFEQAVLLAHALRAICPYSAEQFKSWCEVHKDFLLGIYSVSEANYRHVVGSVISLESIREINSYRFMRLRLLISNLVVELINSHGVTRSIAEFGDAIENSIKSRLDSFAFYGEQPSVVRLLSGMVEMFYEEARLAIAYISKNNLLKDAADCSFRLVRGNEVVVRYRPVIQRIKVIRK